MSRHPLRSWSITLQQSWNLRLKEKDKTGFEVQPGGNFSPAGSKRDRSTKKDLCWRFNRGKCSYGLNCRFDHRCAICTKFGHGAHICRRAGENQDRDRQDRPPRREDRDKDRNGKQEGRAGIVKH